MSSSASGHTAPAERPERSRNAKAQARHRAKRKAYIEQLEQTVTKLQTALGFSQEEVQALPPPLAKIRELEHENARLSRENDELRRLLDASGRTLPADLVRRPSTSFMDTRSCNDRSDYKRRKTMDEVYINPDPAPHSSEILSRPPPLTIPQQPMPHHYSSLPSHTNSAHANTTNGSGLFSLHAPAFQLPNTPSGSSSTSSPPFSPAQMQSTNSPVTHRSQLQTPQPVSAYPSSNAHYGSVKVEEENYSHSNHSSQYIPQTYTHSTQEHGLDTSWHYSSERAALSHR